MNFKIESDFSQFQFTEEFDLIIALNCLYYLFRNDNFRSSRLPFFQNLLYSISPNGELFIDAETWNWLKEFEFPDFEIEFLGIFNYRFTRKLKNLTTTLPTIEN